MVPTKKNFRRRRDKSDSYPDQRRKTNRSKQKEEKKVKGLLFLWKKFATRPRLRIDRKWRNK
jgi:hypothetical protein